MIISRWLNERKLKSKRDTHMRGYEYAAGQLLSDGKAYKKATMKRLENEAHNGKAFDNSPFDDGILQAVSDFEKLMKKL